jgi:UDP-N-acetylmuramoylalanine--D-glutamate ligase
LDYRHRVGIDIGKYAKTQIRKFKKSTLMDLSNKHIVVVGLGCTGLATTRFLIQKGAKVTVSDMAPVDELYDKAHEAHEMGAVLELGGHRSNTFDQADLIVVSPGVPHTVLPLQQAQAKGIEVIGEMELAYRFIKEPIVAITGTNGKTTTAELLGHILSYANRPFFLGGNIGTPLITYITDQNMRASVLVVEVSSFQLDTIKTFRPKVAILLNISSDHFDRYKDMNAYVFSKGRIFENQNEEDIAIYNGNDPRIMALIPAIKSQKKLFGHVAHNSNDEGDEKALIDTNRILIQSSGKPPLHFDLSTSSLRGSHNLENAAAAILAAKALDVDSETIQKALKTFTIHPHRLEPVSTINGVTYINDSKATNVGAVARALACFTTSVILIMGGRNKNNDFRYLWEPVHQHVITLITYGEAGTEIQAALEGACSGRCEVRQHFKDAVLLAHHLAQPGQTVLLSPACASFDQFGSYLERGETFRRLVESLA